MRQWARSWTALGDSFVYLYGVVLPCDVGILGRCNRCWTLDCGIGTPVPGFKFRKPSRTLLCGTKETCEIYSAWLFNIKWSLSCLHISASQSASNSLFVSSANLMPCVKCINTSSSLINHKKMPSSSFRPKASPSAFESFNIEIEFFRSPENHPPLSRIMAF